MTVLKAIRVMTISKAELETIFCTATEATTQSREEAVMMKCTEEVKMTNCTDRRELIKLMEEMETMSYVAVKATISWTEVKATISSMVESITTP